MAVSPPAVRQTHRVPAWQTALRRARRRVWARELVRAAWVRQTADPVRIPAAVPARRQTRERPAAAADRVRVKAPMLVQAAELPAQTLPARGLPAGPRPAETRSRHRR